MVSPSASQRHQWVVGTCQPVGNCLAVPKPVPSWPHRPAPSGATLVLYRGLRVSRRTIGPEVAVHTVPRLPHRRYRSSSSSLLYSYTRYRVDGELAAFFTAADEQFMVRRTLSRLVEMCGEEPES